MRVVRGKNLRRRGSPTGLSAVFLNREERKERKGSPTAPESKS